MSETEKERVLKAIKTEMDKLIDCKIKGSKYVSQAGIGIFSLQVEKNGKTLIFALAFQRLLGMETGEVKKQKNIFEAS